MHKSNFFHFTFIALTFFFAGCSHVEDKDLEDRASEKRVPKTKQERMQEKTKGYIFGQPLLSIGSKKAEETNIGVNSYLWRASLDVLSALPKVKADPFGGVIVTDWSTLSDNERLKLEVIIIGRQLRADALRVSVFRQVKKGGKWQEGEVSSQTIDEIEETILKRARAIRVQEEK